MPYFPQVSTLGERIVLYVLNRIVLRNEKSTEDVFFLCHSEHEAAKILWKDGKAIGFYSLKPKGNGSSFKASYTVSNLICWLLHISLHLQVVYAESS